MAGVYVHIPFCRQACHYCDFHFSTTLKGMDDMVDGLVQEARLRVQGSERWAGLDWSTLYLGGGTPSLLTPEQLARLMEGLATGLGLDSLQEVTLEANPEDLSETNILAWKGLGIERLSVGIQSFHDKTLVWMNRAHQGEEAARGIQLAHDLGIRAISADLIYGVPTERSWQADVERATRLPIQHLSAYSLTVEHQTVLGHRVAKGLQPEAPDERVRLEYDLLCQAMAERGWAHYETSNWAAPDGQGGHQRAQHNSAYWAGTPYLGLGPGAHGFDGKTRYANVSNNPLYLRHVQGGALREERDALRPSDRYNEALMTGLRTAKGIHPETLAAKWGRSPIIADAATWQRCVDAGTLVALNDGWWRVPEEHWLIGDQVSGSLFWVD